MVSLDLEEKKETGASVERRGIAVSRVGKERKARRASRDPQAWTSRVLWAPMDCLCLAAGISDPEHAVHNLYRSLWTFLTFVKTKQ